MAANQAHRSGASGATIIVLTSLYSIIGGLSVDIFLPSLPSIESAFDISRLVVQQTLTTYLVSYAIGCLVFGQVSDYFGRRPTMLLGLLVFAGASFIAFFTDSYSVLLLCRVIQGLGSSVGKVVCRAIIADQFDTQRAQKVLSAVSAMFWIAPVVGPILGGWLHASYGWRSSFLFMGLFALATLVLCFVLLRETNPGKASGSMVMHHFAGDVLTLLRHRYFVLVALLAGLFSAPMFLYVTSAPVVVREHWGLSDGGYAWLSVPIGLGILLGSITCHWLSSRLSRSTQTSLAISLLIVACAGAVALTSIFSPDDPRWLAIPIALCAAGSSMIFPVLMMHAFECAPESRGLASSLFNAISLGFLSFVGGVVAPLAATSASTLALAALVGALGALGLRQRHRYEGAVNSRAQGLPHE